MNAASDPNLGDIPELYIHKRAMNVDVGETQSRRIHMCLRFSLTLFPTLLTEDVLRDSMESDLSLRTFYLLQTVLKGIAMPHGCAENDSVNFSYTIE